MFDCSLAFLRYSFSEEDFGQDLLSKEYFLRVIVYDFVVCGYALLRVQKVSVS